MPIATGFKQPFPLGVSSFNVQSGTTQQGLFCTVVSFQITTASGTIFTVPYSLPVNPQIVLASISGRTETTETAGRLRNKKGFGIAMKAGPLQDITQFAFGSNSDDNAVLTGASNYIRHDCLVTTMSSGAAPSAFSQGALSLLSIDSGIATFQVIQAFDLAYIVSLQLIGGTDLTRMDFRGYTSSATTGLESRTEPGFKPDFLMVFGANNNNSSGPGTSTANDSSFFIGAADKNLNQFITGDGVNDGGGTGSGRSMHYTRSGEIIAHWNSSVNGFDTHGILSSMDPQGFTINWTRAINRVYFALAIQGANWSIGNFNSLNTSVETQVVNTLTFQPDGLMLFGTGYPASTLDQPDAQDQFNMGFVGTYPSLTNYDEYVFGKNLVANTIQGAGYSNTHSYLETNVSSGTITSAARVTSMQSTGFNMIFDTINSGAAFIPYVAFGHIITPPFQTIVKTIKPSGGGDYPTLASGLATEIFTHQNLISQNIILEFDCYPGIEYHGDDVPLVIHGWNEARNIGYKTDPNHFIVIKCIGGHQGLFDSSGSTYLFDFFSPSASQNPIVVRNEYVKIFQFQARITAASGTSHPAVYVTSSTGVVPPTDNYFVNCLAKGNLASGAAYDGFLVGNATLNLPGVKSTLINCVAYDFLSLDVTMTGFNTGASTSPVITIINCGAYNCNQGFQDHSNVTTINSVALGCDNGWNTANGPGPNSRNNFSMCGPATIISSGYWPGTLQTEVPDAKGIRSFNAVPVLLRDPINGDYRPQPNDTTLNNGIDASSYSPLAITTDVAGVARTGTWTIGPFQNNNQTSGILYCGGQSQSSTQSCWWGITGNVTDTTATLATKLNLASSSVFFDVSQNADMSSATRYGPTGTNANNVAKFNLTTLSNTQYYWQVVIGGTRIGKVWSFKSFPPANTPASFVFACGGCADTGSNSNIFTAVKNKSPLIFINYGDLHYYNTNTNDITIHRQAFDTAMLAPKQQALFGTTAFDWQWDDHDFGKDNADDTSPAEPAAQSFYRETFPNYPLPASGPTYHSFIIGRCRFILTDLRSERDPNGNPDGPSHTMMSSTQLAWFENELLLAKNNKQVAFWFSTVPWTINSGIDGNSGDSWGGFTNQRGVISNYIRDLNYKSIIICCGDMHACVIDDGTHDVYNTDGSGNNLVMFLPFPMNQTTQIYSGNWTQGPLPHQATRLMGFAGIVTVTDSINQICAQLDIINEKGTQLTYTKCFTISSGAVDQLAGTIIINSWFDDTKQITGISNLTASLTGGH